jgi:hypothetical protein
MEASALTTAVLAAATVVPGHPVIEVWLRNWENKTKTRVEFCRMSKISPIQSQPQKPPLIQLDPGNKNVDTQIYLERYSQTKFSGSLRVALPLDDTPNYINVAFTYYDHGAFQIGCVHTHRVHTVEAIVNRVNGLLDERITWNRAEPPKYILIEIDGTIVQEDLRNTSFKVEHEMFRLEKLA